MKNKKTKVLKITAIVLGSIVLAVVMIIVLVALMTGMVKKAYGEHSKHKPEISIEYQGTPPKSNYDYEKIPDESYYPTIQEAMKNHEFQGEEMEEYQKNMDEIIAQFENEEYISVYYIAIKNEKETADIFAKFKIKEIEGQKKYAFIRMGIDSISKKGILPMEPAIETLYSQLSISDYLRGDGIDPENERFVWGGIM